MCLREAFIGIFLPLFVHVRIETSVCTFGVFSYSVFLLLFAEGLKRIDKLNCWKLEFCRKQLFKQTETVFTRANKPLQNIFSGISLFCIWHPLEFKFFFLICTVVTHWIQKIFHWFIHVKGNLPGMRIFSW